ncbi:mediator complex subunit MED14-domain-containing protein [Dipodascopsis tothii]|uniref:mediator complex subunit MED14-domain-containing protein n=1 Tax=Dipodascopsis tothii TaxID=44089 RepID=UPI0034CE0E32
MSATDETGAAGAAGGLTKAAGGAGAVPAIAHISDNFLPLAYVVARTVEHTYAELVNILETFPAANDSTRKRKFLGFLVHTRQQFIKLLVLTQWARSASEVSRVIDVVSWLGGQKNCFVNVIWALQSVKHGLSSARLPNPDIGTALEVFTRGQPRLSTFNFVPPPALTARRVLGVLHDLNVLLSIRLALYENIPPPFRRFSIGNGRVTFVVRDEFEVDVGIADDDPGARFFLIDFRFLFAAAGALGSGIRSEVERVADEFLATKGLAGLYDFLHNFTLSYKLLLIHRQAQALTKGVWADIVKIAFVPDSQLISVQYWLGRPGGRNAFEIGLLRAKTLGVRWTPEGRARPFLFALDQTEISAERILSKVVTLHRQYLLALVYKHFVASPAYAQVPHLITPQVHDMKLRVELAPTKVTYLTIEPLTGRAVFETTSDLVRYAERSLNSQRDVAQTAATVLVSLRHLSMQQELEAVAAGCGWNTFRITNIKVDDVRQKLGAGVRQISTLRRDAWPAGWFVVVTFGDAGARWWLAELASGDVGWTIAWFESVKLFGPAGECTPPLLERLDTLAAARIAFHAITQGLHARGIRYKYAADGDIPRLIFDSTSLTRTRWTCSAVHMRFEPAAAGVAPAVVLLGRVRRPLAWRAIASDVPGVALNPRTGLFALRLDLAADVLDVAIERIDRIERVAAFIDILGSFALAIDAVSLTRVAFGYGRPALRAAVTLAGDAMRLELDAANPHRLIQHFLQDILNVEGFHYMVTMLQLTLPLLQAAHALDRADVYTLAHSVVNYRLVYHARRHCFDAGLKRKNGRVVVYIADAAAKMPGFRPAPQCAELWNASRPGVTGLEVGVACDMDHVAETIAELNTLVAKSEP